MAKNSPKLIRLPLQGKIKCSLRIFLERAVEKSFYKMSVNDSKPTYVNFDFQESIINTSQQFVNIRAVCTNL